MTLDTTPCFLGALRIKNESAHIAEVLTSILPLCSRIFVFDDHSTDDTAAICQSFGAERVLVFNSPFEGLDEARDKNWLLSLIVQTDADWVLWIDGDEVLERTGPDQLRAAVRNRPRTGSFALRIAYVWNSPDTIRVDGIFGRFARPSVFRLKWQNINRLHFPTTRQGGNFHCGNVPLGVDGKVEWLGVRLKHYGYMTYEQRMGKYRWYNAHDPHNQLEDEYRHIVEIPGARHAPGPTQLVRWEE